MSIKQTQIAVFFVEYIMRRWFYSQHVIHHFRRIMKKLGYLILVLFNLSVLYAQTDDTDWKLYTNVHHNFRLYYPEFCTEIDTSGPLSSELRRLKSERNGLSFWLDKKIFTANFGNPSVPVFSVTIFDNADNIDLESFIYKVINQNPGFYKEEELAYQHIALDNHYAEKVSYHSKAGGYDGINKDVFVKNGGFVYAIMIINPPGGDYDMFLQKILASFKFLN
jgi:hypothetical protein